MRLLMISGDRALAQGKKGAFYNTLEEFHKYWNRIDIICPKSTTGMQAYQTNQFFGNVFVHSSPWPLIFQPIWIYKKGKELFQKNKFNLVTVHEYPPFYNGIGAWFLWLKIKVPYVLEILHIPGYPRYADFKEWLYRILVKFFIQLDSRRAVKIRVINKKETPNFLIRSGVSKVKLIYIPAFYIDLETFKPIRNISKQYDLIFVGRLAKNKGLSLLINAVKELKATLMIVGIGPLKKKLELQIKKFGLENRVNYQWAKSRSEVAELMNKSRILVMPSYNEGGPRVILEAMACGLPFLATSVGIVHDLIRDGLPGFVIDWDSHDIARKVEKLLNNNSEYQKFSKIGITLVQQFEQKSAIKNYAEKLKACINL